jgi:hypothetical protein
MISTDAMITLTSRKGRTYQLVPGSMSVGRDPKNKLQVKSKLVSRFHAIFERLNDSVWITDLNSANGTYINGKRIEGGTRIFLRDGDEVQFTQKVSPLIIRGNQALDPKTETQPKDNTLKSNEVTGSTEHFGFAPDAVDFVKLGVGKGAAQTLSKRFRPMRILNTGGMGKIILAQDVLSGRFVAVKVMLGEIGQSEPHVQQFIREAVITARLQHPHIIPVYDLGFFTDNQLFYTMRFVDGQTFDRIMFDVDLPERLRILRNAALAVDHAHSEGLWHRDLKPHNILVGPIGDTYVIDWGLVTVRTGYNYRLSLPKILVHQQAIVVPDNLIQITDQALTSATSPGQGKRLGTPPWMAPEQISGEESKMGTQSDVWAFGIMLYQILTDKHPFEESLHLITQLIPRILGEDIPPPSKFDADVPVELDSLCQRMLVRKHEDRMQSLKEFSQEIGRFLRRHYKSLS